MKARKPDNVRPLSYVLLKKFGLRGALQIIKEDVLFDIFNGVDTVRAVSNASLFTPALAKTQNRYVPSTFGSINSIVTFLSSHMAIEETGFVDLGSGKAKAVIAANRWPFRSIRGIEFSPELHRIACKNLKRLQLTERIDLSNGNAIDVILEEHERLVFLFNPFTGETLEACLNNISRQNGERWIVCMNPTEDDVYQRYFEKVAHEYFNPGDVEVCFYKTKQPNHLNPNNR